MTSANVFYGQVDDEAIDALTRLEREMYLAGDSRSDIIRQALDVLSMNGAIDDRYEPPKLQYGYD